MCFVAIEVATSAGSLGAVEVEPAPRRPKVERFVRRRVCEIPLHEREALFARLYATLCETYEGLSRERFEQVYLQPQNLLGLGYAGDGSYAGFIAVNQREYEIHGRRHMVFNSLVAISLGFRGGSASMNFAMLTALRYKLRHPRRSTTYVAIASTPAAYRVNVELAPRVYPSEGRSTPMRVRALLEQVSRGLGLATLEAEPRIIRCRMLPRDRGRIDGSRELAKSESTRFYERIAPRWAEGECPLICVMLDFNDIFRALGRLGWRALSTC